MTGERIISVDLTITVKRDPIADVWVGYCPALDLYSQGETIDEAFAATKEAVNLWIKYAEPRLLREFNK